MNEFVDIIVIYIVLRAILAFLGAWWHGGMETDATISDETDKRIGLNSFVYYYLISYMSIIPVSIRNHHGKSSVGSFHHLCRCFRL